MVRAIPFKSVQGGGREKCEIKIGSGRSKENRNMGVGVRRKIEIGRVPALTPVHIEME